MFKNGEGEVFTVDTPLLQKLTVKTVSTKQCNEQWSSVAGDGPQDGVVCSQSSASAGICNGDSGGPLVYRGRQVGIASYVRPGCDGSAPDVWTSIRDIQDWIRKEAR